LKVDKSIDGVKDSISYSAGRIEDSELLSTPGINAQKNNGENNTRKGNELYGTFIAQYEIKMNSKQDIDKFAVLERQKIPVEANLPGDANEVGEKIFDRKYQQSFETGQVNPGSSLTQEYQKIAVEYTADYDGGEIKIKSLSEKLVDEIKSHLLTIRHNHSDNALTVKLMPDSETELSLRMVLNGGKILATAFLEKGDWYLLKSQWGELQNMVAKYGVELGSLNIDSGANQNARHWSYREFYPDSIDTGIKANRLPGNMPSTEQANKYSRVHHGWECWA
ncbi:MAG: hypothetical protein ACPMAG_14700, partial [Limisphaerales bacterium]